MPATQSLTAVAIADTNGKATFTFPQAPTGSVVQGTVSVPTAPLTASISAQVNGLTWGTFNGYNPWGPIQLGKGQTLSLVATGLTANTSYNAIWIVGVFTEDQAPSPPVPYGSITNISSTTNNPVIVQFPTPPSNVFNGSENLQMDGSAQQLANLPCQVGIAMLADPNNGHAIYVSGSGVSGGSGYLFGGQGLVLPVANANVVWVLGISGTDTISYWTV